MFALPAHTVVVSVLVTVTGAGHSSAHALPLNTIKAKEPRESHRNGREVAVILSWMWLRELMRS